MSEILSSSEYKAFIGTIKSQIQSAQIKAAVSVNSELLHLYWFIAQQMVQKQKTTRWGEGLVKQVSRDLQQDFPDMKGFSTRNIHMMKQWYLYWHKEVSIVQQAVAQLEQTPIFQIPWGQNLLIISRSHAPAWECIPRHK